MQRTDDYIRPRGYYDNPGNLLTVGFDKINQLSGISSGVTGAMFNNLSGISSGTTAGMLNLISGLTASAGQINNILYGSAVVKYAIGSSNASNAMTISHGLSSSFACFVNAQSGGLLVGGVTTGSQITFYISTRLGTGTSGTVNWIVYGS